MRQVFNKLKQFNYFVFLILMSLVARVSYALDYSGSLEDPDPADIIVPFARLFNAFLLVAGSILVIMILYGAIKLSMALGKPMEFEGAKKTFTFAIFGFAIVVGFFALWRFITGAMGLSAFATPGAVFQAIIDGINEFIDAGHVFN